jgi:hypothetical protein
VSEERVGDAAWRQRYALKTVSREEDRIKPIETLLARSLSTYRLASIDRQSGADGKTVRLFLFAGGGSLRQAGGRLAAGPAAGDWQQIQ